MDLEEMMRKRHTSPMLPPPAVPGEDLRTLLVRTALANPSLMAFATEPSEAVRRAIAIADEMIRALNNTETPTIRHMSDEEMAHWEHELGKQKAEKERRDSLSTMPAIPSIKQQERPAIPPPPMPLPRRRRLWTLSLRENGRPRRLQQGHRFFPHRGNNNSP